MKSKTKLLISSALALALGLFVAKTVIAKKFPTDAARVDLRAPVCEVVTSVDC